MVRIILDNADIEKLIKEKYANCTIVSGLDTVTDIVIRVEDIRTVTNHVTPPPAPPKQDPSAVNGLALENRDTTVPGKAMGKSRNELPVF